MTPLEQTLITAAAGGGAGATVTFVGVLITQLATGRRESRARYEAHLTRVIAKRYELYSSYLEILDRNADALTSAAMLTDREVTVSETHMIEKDMALFANTDVLAVAEIYRDGIRRAALTASGMSEKELERLRLDLSLASHALLAAMRTDVGIDSLSFGTRRGRKRVFGRLAGNAVVSHVEVLTHLGFDPIPTSGVASAADRGWWTRTRRRVASWIEPRPPSGDEGEE